MLDREQERSVDVHLDWFLGLHESEERAHRHGGGRRCFRAFLIERDEGMMKHFGQREIVVWFPRCDPIKVGTARGLIERAFQSEAAERSAERNGRSFDPELWQVKRDR